MTKLVMVEVLWDDHAFWDTDEEDLALVRRQTVGYLVREDDAVIVTASTSDEYGYRELTVLGKSMVVSVRRLR